jgi:hypothetical protein
MAHGAIACSDGHGGRQRTSFHVTAAI